MTIKSFLPQGLKNLETELRTIKGVESHLIHPQALNSLSSLQHLAKEQGFDIYIVSSFRSFDRQKLIWNEKASGKRDLYNPEGTNKLEFSTLSQEEILNSILRWSGLPGFSRHHWGTELDIVDKNAFPEENYSVQLTIEEVNGIFSPFYQWLETQINNNNSFGFYMPYSEDRNGVSPEKWHISYAPLSQEIEEKLTFECFKESIQGPAYEDLELIELIKKNLLSIYENYITNTCDIPFKNFIS